MRASLIDRLRAVDHASVEDCFLQSPLFAEAAEALEAAEARALAAESALANVAGTIDEWSKPQTMKLHAGEMTGGEVRTAQAILKGLAAAIRA